MKSKSKLIFLLLVFDVACIVLLYVTTLNDNMHNPLKDDIKTRDVNLTRVLYSKNALGRRDSLAVSLNMETLIYSAYAEDIGIGQYRLRAIGVTLNRNRSVLTETIHCRLRYKKPDDQLTTAYISGFVENIPEHHDLNYTAAYFICPLHHLPIPDAVSVIFNNITNQEKYIPVTRILNLKKKHLFTMCVSPMHSGYNKSSQLLEWIELNRILGVQKFNIYVHNVSYAIMAILRHYETEGIVEILPWSIPPYLCSMDETPPLHSCGQLAALNDCLYRSKGRSDYISSIDLDEFIIPQNKDDITWSDMLTRLPVNSGYLFLNSFISASTTAERDDYLKTHLKTMSYLTRDNVFFIGRVRSKVIARTDLVITLGVHLVWSFTSGREISVYPHEGLLHHYRDKLFEYPEDVHVKRLKTKATLKYYKDLQQRVFFMRDKLKEL